MMTALLTRAAMGRVIFVCSCLVLLPGYLISQWSIIPSGTTNDLFDVKFISSTEGWIVGNLGTILHSTDEGETWVAQVSSTVKNRGAVFFTSTTKGVAVGESAVLSTTTNGGTTWTSSQFTGIGGPFLHDIYFPSASIGYIVGNTGTIFKTTNGASSWMDISRNVETRQRSVFFINTTKGWIVGTGGNIVVTTNGGSSWSNQFAQQGIQFHDVEFVDNNTGWVVGSNGLIKKTTNAGGLWSNQTSGTTVLLHDVDFVDANYGWAVGENGTILHTVDGGTTWFPQSSGVTAELHAIRAFSDQVAIAVGAGGIILKTTNGGGVLPIELTSFIAKLTDYTSVALQWKTASEINNKGFEIQWSTNGSQWQNLGFVQGYGNTNAPRQYFFTHGGPVAGVNYYRLKQMDYDGAYDYSPVRTVQLDANVLEVKIYPNPVTGRLLHLHFNQTIDQPIDFQVFTARGKLLKHKTISVAQETVTVDLHDVNNPGLYFIRLVSGDFEKEEKILVQ